jgi:type IV pilus assembly protein PilV
MKRKKSHRGRTPANIHDRCRQSGFSIIEVMIAISILSIGILALASMQVAAMRGNSFAGSVTEGSTWALDQIEKLMNLQWDDASLQDADADGATGLANIGADADFMVTRGRYAIHWNVANDVVTANTRTINVIVTWSDHGVQKSASIERVMARII